MEDRSSFIFYRSFKDSIKNLSNEEKLIMYEAISDYGLDQKEPQLTGFPEALFALIRPLLDANFKRWQNGCKGGAPKGSHNNPNGRKKRKFNQKLTENIPLSNQKLTKNKANVYVYDNVNVYDNHDVNNNEETKIKKENLSLNERKKVFHDSLEKYIERYGKQMITNFYLYWTEPNKSQTKMRYEMQKTWSLVGRLHTWEERSINGK